jgi:L-alanine-DL-glutamate epimerase-like enolase superfamily enzyme
MSAFRIRDVRVRKEALGLLRPYTIAYKTVSAVDCAVCEIETDAGLVGTGTANPSPQVVGESVDDVVADVSRADLGFLIGEDVRDADRLAFLVARRFAGKPGATAAVDIALWDLCAQAAGRPLADVLGRHHVALPTSITIGIKDVAQTLAEADEYTGRGFRILKVKIGRGADEDLERLSALRARHPAAVLRVDANQGYAPDSLRAFWARARELNLELIEEPLPAGRLDDYAGLPADLKARVFLDESVKDAGDALAVAHARAAGGLNIKLMKSGGVRGARLVAGVAEAAGLALMWGCNDESVVAIAAALHVAFASPATRHLDLDGSLDLGRDLATGGVIIEAGVMRTTERPGLGLLRTQ